MDFSVSVTAEELQKLSKRARYVIVTQKGVNIPNQPITKTSYYVDYCVFNGLQESCQIEDAVKFYSVETANSELAYLQFCDENFLNFTVEQVYQKIS